MNKKFDMTFDELQEKYPKYRWGNISKTPKFVDEANRDFDLRPDSPMIYAGIFLTKTITPGDNKNIQVEDASYFMDSCGLINGDINQLEGQTQTAIITNIDYTNNIITVDQNLAWKRGVGFSLAYKDSAPDIGAYEFFE